MAVIRSSIRPLLGASLLAVLAACGGGGGDGGDKGGTGTDNGDGTTSDVVDKYVGTWGGCFADSGGGTGSSQDELVISKTSATSVEFTSSSSHFATTNCTGPSTPEDDESGTATWVGTKTVGTETVDKVDIVQGGQTIKNILVIRSDGKFYSGVDASDGGTVDAQGYPTMLQAQGDSKLS